MKKYETDFFWSFKDEEAKYENGITELIYADKKIGTVTATDDEVIYNFEGISQWLISNNRREILNSSEKKAEIYINGKKIVEKDFSGNFILYEDTEDFGKFINSAKEVKNERQIIRIENLSGNFRAEFQDEKFKVLESVGKAKAEFENSDEMSKTENGYTAVLGNKVSVYVNPENLIDGVILFEHMVNLEYSPFQEKEVYKKAAEMLRKTLNENLIGEEGASPNLEKELAKDRVRIDRIYAFQKMFGLSINLPYEKVLELSRENIKGPKVYLALSFETETFSGTVHLLQNKARIKIEKKKISFDHTLKIYRELMSITKTGYSLILDILPDNPVIDFMEADGTINVRKRKYAKTDFKKLQKLSEETSKKIEFEVVSEYGEFEIDKDTLIIPQYLSENDTIPEKYKTLENYFKRVEVFSE